MNDGKDVVFRGWSPPKSDPVIEKLQQETEKTNRQVREARNGVIARSAHM
jgi:hypothetical protein